MWHRVSGRISLLATVLLNLSVLHGYAHAASAEPTELEPEWQAKVARERLKQNQANAGVAREGAGRNSGCGQIDIGNSDNSRKGAGSINAKEKTVIVTGPVINATNCR